MDLRYAIPDNPFCYSVNQILHRDFCTSLLLGMQKRAHCRPVKPWICKLKMVIHILRRPQKITIFPHIVAVETILFLEVGVWRVFKRGNYCFLTFWKLYTPILKNEKKNQLLYFMQFRLTLNDAGF